MKKILKYSLVLLLTAGFITSCDGILEPSVDQEQLTEEAINTVEDLEAFVLAVHDVLNSTALFGRDFYVGPDVMSDNAWSNGNSGRFTNHRDFNFPITNAYPAGIWNNFYQAIANTNIIINSDLDDGSPRAEYARGQGYALRAFSHFQLLLAFGQQYVDGGDASLGVPYAETYADGNLFPSRDAIADVWTSIEDDFNTAISLMSPELDGDATTINYMAVRALQSRFYLHTGNFDAAIAAADEVINSGQFSIVPASDLVSTWASGSGPNSLFELAFTDTDRLGVDNIARILRDTNYGDVEITEDLFSAYDENDARLGLMTDEGDGRYRMSGKYVDELGTDNVRIIRYAEVLLNKAEALSRRGDQPEALEIINNLSAERGSANQYDAGTPENVLAERRLELALEGQRLFDLARHEMDVPNPPTPSGFSRFNNGEDLPFGDYRYALPIPNAEMNANGNMVQNQGY
ncbi:MAG: RagB/SusD family nutrient uptake outer membrane protein [Balneolaceae bacterium]|nr:RagB/SusD family nutrient uptake outer membrane protein [Balneolaceae bacterium]